MSSNHQLVIDFVRKVGYPVSVDEVLEGLDDLLTEAQIYDGIRWATQNVALRFNSEMKLTER